MRSVNALFGEFSQIFVIVISFLQESVELLQDKTIPHKIIITKYIS
ncbi:MAG: hypothetical protein JJE45_06790, partial [Prolixibacteraceae bacterium]|nr:hypothetical protein [Prolixibacteraceae bacterium]